jgi:radical SAM protein with 4Fe4S-binding SPASM domain
MHVSQAHHVLDRQWPYLVSFEITNKCNYRCIYCYQASRFENNADKEWTIASSEEPEMTLDEIRQYLLPQVAEMQFQNFCFIGAECLLRFKDIIALGPDFHDIKTVKEIMMSTNGYLLTGEIIDQFKTAYKGKFISMAIPLDSLKPETVRTLRPPKQDVFERSIAAIKLATKKGIYFTVETVANKLNFDELEDIMRYLKKIGHGRIFQELYPLLSTGKGSENTDLCLTPDQLRELDRLKIKYFGNPVLMWDSMPCPWPEDAWKKVSKDAFETSIAQGCSAGNNYFNIDHAGNVYPCNFLTYNLGNIKDGPHALEQIWNTHPDVQRLRNRELEGKCGSCLHRVTCGGCRARATMETGSLFGGVESCEGGPEGHPLSAAATRTMLKTYRKYKFLKNGYNALVRMGLIR